jgi:cytochrome b
VLALFATVGSLAVSGWLYTTDRFFGDETVECVHVALAWAIVVLVGLHVAGVAIASRRHRENLVAAMAHGRKREARDSDID